MAFPNLIRGSIALAGWDCFVNGEIERAIGQSVTEAIRATFEGESPYVSLPWTWAIGESPCDGYGNPPISDPLTVRFQVPLGSDDDGEPTYEFSFRDLAFELIEDHQRGQGGPIGAKEAAGIRQFAAALRKLADDIDLTVDALHADL